MAMEFQRVLVDGVELRTAEVRRGRPTLVLTNAFPQSIRCWESLWDRLAERFDVVAVDLPGFGMSGGSGSLMRPSAQADVLMKLMDAKGVDRAFVVGPDVGTPIALWLASTHPARLYGINVFDGPGFWPPHFDPTLRAATRSRLVRWLGTRAPMQRRLMAQNLRVATGGGYDHFSPSEAAKEEYRQICFDTVKHRNAFDYLGSYADELPQLGERLSSVTVPVLITWGAQDAFVLPSNAERLHALLPDSELTVFDEAGHFSHEDADSSWLDRLTTFAKRCIDDREVVAPAVARP
jgi:pimeloyl-ACP methyl ester carboxylesterase